ncbi:energy-coupling factor ABC transporter ATP-binding protein, partial [Paratractidigestivibacter sp.]
PNVCEIRGVGYSYGRGKKALDNVTFSVRRGESVAIVGQTGSGKSTLLRLMCGLEAPDAGSISVAGVSTAKKRGQREVRRMVGYVMQHPERQLFAQTVAEDVAFGPRNLGLSADEVTRRVDHAFELVGLGEKRGASPFELSGGQRRLAAIAGVLAMEPELLILDEPTAGLDPRGRARLRELLADLRGHGVTLVQVTHSMDDAARADRVVVLDQSRVIADGAPAEVFSRANEAQLRACGLGIPKPLAHARGLETAGHAPLGDPPTIEALAKVLNATEGASGNGI